ncbi:hypothetical protein STANM309S_06031 [Streptomyces tanashiensis]
MPATTIEAIVEMLTVLAPSPPVPTMSTAGPGTSITLACAYMVRTRPVISCTVSPLARSATMNPAIWASVASPLMIRSIAQAVSSAERSLPSSSPFSRTGQERPAVVGPPAGVAALMAAPGDHVTDTVPPYRAPGTAKSPVHRMDGALAVATYKVR